MCHWRWDTLSNRVLNLCPSSSKRYSLLHKAWETGFASLDLIITVFCSAKGKLTWAELGPVSTLTPPACSWQLWSALECFLQLRGISGKTKLTVMVWGAAWTNVFFRDRLWLTLQICLTIFYSKCSCCLSSEQEELVWLLSFKWCILSHGKK